MTSPDSSARDLRDAQLAAVLAEAVRNEQLAPADALRVIRHEMRRRNTNRKPAIKRRSLEAQRVIEKYNGLGVPIPKNSSAEALHADHVHALTVQTLRTTETTEEWLVELARLREVVCVTAEENYRLEQLERRGSTGIEKYREANIEWAPEG